MGIVRAWIQRRRVLAAFAGGVLLTVAAVAVVAYLVLADQRRSARVLAAALSQALRREVQIERVIELGPSRVVLRGLRLPAAPGWPAEVKAESVEASGPLLSGARGESAPVRVVVTRPTITAGGGAAGAMPLETVRLSLESFLGSAALLDLGVTGGVLEVPGAASDAVSFDAVLRKGTNEARGEVVFRDQGKSRFTLALTARTEGDGIRLDLLGEGGLDPLSAWLPMALTQASRGAPADVRARLDLSPGDRAAGRASARLGDRAALEGTVSFEGKRLRVRDLRGTADLGIVGPAVGLAAPVTGHAELADGEVTWMVERGGWPEARVTLHLLDATLPASAIGVDMLTRGVEARLTLTPREGGASAQGDLRGERVEVAGFPLAPVATPLKVDLDASGAPTRLELTGVTADALGVPVRGTAVYDVARARIDARIEAAAARFDALARHLGGDWLGASDQLRARSVRVVVTGLAPAGWSDGKVDAEVRDLALQQPGGEAGVERAHVQATVRSGGATVLLEAERVRGTLPHFEGQLARINGSADVVRDDRGTSVGRASVVALDWEGREMIQAELGRPAPGVGGPIRLTARVPALDRLAPLWPSIPRQVAGSATVELESPDMGLGSYEGHLALRVASVELPDRRLSLRDVSADVPIRRGVPVGTGAPPTGPVQVGELVGYSVVLYDLAARARAVDERLTLSDLHYGLYSGSGQGTVELELATDGPSARAQLSGAGVRIEDFVAAYGIRGGTMTGLMRYDLDVRYRGGRLGADGRFQVPDGGTVTIELLDRLLSWTDADPTGVAKRALANVRAFDYKGADASVRTAAADLRVSLSLRGREIFGIFPPKVKEINVSDMPIGFLARQFPSR